jgi:pilus assembly protein CpaB
MKLRIAPRLAGLKTLKIDRTWVVLGLALTVGVVAAWSARSYLSGRVAAIEAKNRGDTVQVVVAKGDLPRGAKLSHQNLAVRDVPKAYAHSGAVLPGQFGRVDGQVIAHAIKGGEMLMWTQLETRKAPTFSARVEAGRRAVTVPVDEISSISGLLEPGDQVDLVVTVDRNGQRQSVTVLQNVQVMATGQRSVDDAKSGERRLYTTVTLDTDPQQARNLILARESGRLTALLRNPGDSAPLAGVPADFALWLKPDAAVVPKLAGAAPAATVAKGVPVIYGGRNAQNQADALTLSFKPAGVVQAEPLAPAAPAVAPASPQPANPAPGVVAGMPAAPLR